MYTEDRIIALGCKKIDPDAKLPTFGSDYAACFDIRVCLHEPSVKINGGKDVEYIKKGSNGKNYVHLNPQTVMMVPTGLIFVIPQDLQMKIIPRSGYAWKNKITVLNSPGTIDCVPKGTQIKTSKGNEFVENIFSMNNVEVLSVNDELTKSYNLINHMNIIKNSPLVEIKTENGKIVKIPPTKEVLTKAGWKKIENLTIGEEILTL